MTLDLNVCWQWLKGEWEQGVNRKNEFGELSCGD